MIAAVLFAVHPIHTEAVSTEAVSKTVKWSVTSQAFKYSQFSSILLSPVHKVPNTDYIKVFHLK